MPTFVDLVKALHEAGPGAFSGGLLIIFLLWAMREIVKLRSEAYKVRRERLDLLISTVREYSGSKKINSEAAKTLLTILLSDVSDTNAAKLGLMSRLLLAYFAGMILTCLRYSISTNVFHLRIMDVFRPMVDTFQVSFLETRHALALGVITIPLLGVILTWAILDRNGSTLYYIIFASVMTIILPVIVTGIIDTFILM